MDKIWLKSYPQGIPAEIGPLTESSLAELMASPAVHANVKAYFP